MPSTSLTLPHLGQSECPHSIDEETEAQRKEEPRVPLWVRGRASFLIQGHQAGALPQPECSALSKNSLCDPVQPTVPLWRFLSLIIVYIFGWTGPSLLHGLFCSCSERWLLSSCGARASHCGGFSYCGVRALGLSSFSSCGTWAQQLQLPGPAALWRCGIFLDQGSNPCLLHWQADS